MSLCTRNNPEVTHLQANSKGSSGAPQISPGLVNTSPASPVATPQEGPFDFRSPAQTGRPQVPQAQQPDQQGSASGSQYGSAPFWNTGPLAGERDIQAPTQPEEESEEDKEKHIRCGRALLERAMLGPPLPEGDAPICSSGMTSPLRVAMLGRVAFTRNSFHTSWLHIQSLHSHYMHIPCAGPGCHHNASQASRS